MPLVSVIVPAFNSPHLLRETLHSIMQQSFRDFEVLVVDDGSAPELRTVVIPWKGQVRYFRKENGGPASARNFGISRSAGALLAFCDHDDLWFPHKLARHLEMHRRSPEVGLSFSQVIPFSSQEGPRPALPPLTIRSLGKNAFASFLRRNPIVTSSAVVITRAAVEKAGVFDEDLMQSDDTEYWLRLSRHVPFDFIGEPLVTYRLHAGNLSRNIAVSDREHLAIYEKLHRWPGLGHSARAAVRARWTRHLLSCVRHRLRDGQWHEANSLIREAVRKKPLSLRVRRYQAMTWWRCKKAGEAQQNISDKLLFR
ncbi:MAG: glycosyltransferase family 2 protein [Acidobacteria bacterium]|nr:glycosyltransferase family 2 protein [Acidobacteriota bacterium]